ncbi:hypothetical protein PRIPAC_93088 [Pristionchus pacificus]|uniref:C-type lectin n=1 Tax=Pristionchus pacificus TaxID=54126 RepID=A0A2A6CHX7_PRIPA|nr:hypothetical protein PRIPAC_93088 [Pristionchus pacificus]|eukprot:PDM77663.1 C-type lectin [Pristionchus pacificus]
MWRLLLAFAIMGTAHCSCPRGFDLIANGQCRGFVGFANQTSEQGPMIASQKCSGVQSGHAVSIHNQEQQSYWQSKAPSANEGLLVLGLHCNKLAKKWEWTDGSAMDFKPSNYQSDLDIVCSFDVTWYIQHDGYWTYAAAGSKLHAAISCNADLPHRTFDEGCENFGDDGGNGFCYQIGVKAKSWQDAQSICQEAGANLASIHNDKENAFVHRLALGNGAMQGVYIGASTRNDDEPFRWVDGTSVDYELYGPGSPKPNGGHCVGMETATSGDGFWTNVDCDWTMAYACKRRKRDQVEQPTCYAEDWKENTLITSPGFPSSAATPCDYFLSVDAGKRVSVEIELEANACCDSLVLYEGGSVIATLTGDLHNVTYTTTTSNIMKVSWQPNGGVNVNGLAMTFRSV